MESDDKRCAEHRDDYVDPRDGEVGEEGETAASTSSSSCFVATVVYGDVNATEVAVLRDYRDSVLKKHRLGRWFHDFYYSGAGERVAHIIESRYRFIVPTIRAGLNVVVRNRIKHADNWKHKRKRYLD